MNVIDQAFGRNWANYNGDCVIVLRGLPGKCARLSVYSPPFALLYIYSEHVADMGNCADDDEFFASYDHTLKELYRVTEPGGYQAIHCKDLMRYMSHSGYAGLSDFPGRIIRQAGRHGWLFQRWITVWKDPVVEMQRTKTYGLLHKSFCERAEVTRQGCADYVLVLQKPETEEALHLDDQEPTPIQDDVIRRCMHQWTNEDERDGLLTVRATKNGLLTLSIWNEPLATYTPEFIQQLSDNTAAGRLAVVRCQPLPLVNVAGQVKGYHDTMGDLIQRFEAFNWKFHSRVALTDGYYLVVFRKWAGEFENNVVKHNLRAPEVTEVGRREEVTDEWREPIIRGNEVHADYVGTEPPANWRDDNYYSILVWQKYASPVWHDLRGLPETHPDAWMNIQQTKVLNSEVVRDSEDEKHICPLQLDLIELLVDRYSRPGDVVVSPFGGIGSEGYVAIKKGRKAILMELKTAYWKLGVRHCRQAELESGSVDLFTYAGLEVAA